jgi:DNA-directed RNA polymerase subunit alpha
LGLQLKDSPPGFDPSAVAAEYSIDGWGEASENGVDNGPDYGPDDGHDYAETEQL